MKLISTTDFVLEQEKKWNYESIGLQNSIRKYKDCVLQMHNYANLLKQKLELWMFVPCDEDGNVLEEPKGWKSYIQENGWKSLHTDALNRCSIYSIAKNSVLFDGFEIESGKEYTKIKNKNISVFYKRVGGKKFKLNQYLEYDIIEDIIPYEIYITPTAIKQIEL